MTENKELTLRMWVEQQRLIAEALLGVHKWQRNA